MKVIKRNGRVETFDIHKVLNAVKKAYKAVGKEPNPKVLDLIEIDFSVENSSIAIETIQDKVERILIANDFEVGKAFMLYREEHRNLRNFVKNKKDFIEKYKKSSNTANATIDDNSNVGGKNIGILNNEIHKEDNIQINRGMIMDKLKELYPNFDAKQYLRDLSNHIIYKNDESSFAGAVSPYCSSVTMYPFLTNGIKDLGGLSAAPKNLDSFCGMYINMIFAISAQFAGAIATSEFLLYFDYFARKEWGDDYYLKDSVIISSDYCNRKKTIGSQIHQYFQQVVYSINQPSAARGLQSAFVNFSYFDKGFFDGMFGNFYFPDGTQPLWDSLNWLQKDFMMWFNNERLRCMLTFPVESFAMIYKDGEFQDKENARFVAEEYARGHSFFTYISDTADSLSSCCRLKNKIQTREFNFTNGNMGVQTGSKSVITLNLNRLIQDSKAKCVEDFCEYLIPILERVYKYHNAYNELLWDMYKANLLPVYKAGFISLDKQYLTIGINGLNQAAEFMGIECNDNEAYSHFCKTIFTAIKEQNNLHKTKHMTFNTECIPAESLAIKNYNWDKADGYWTPTDTNLYASYIFKPNDESISILEKIRLHGKNYIGDALDGGSSAHLNLKEHLSIGQYEHILKYAAENGCQYLTFNVPNCECDDCGFIAKSPFDVCPKCGGKNVTLYDRIIGYISKIKNWSQGRQEEQKTRVYNDGKIS